MTVDEESPAELPGCAMVAAIIVGAVAVLAAIYFGSWAVAELLWWLVETGGWPRATAGLLVAALGCVYVYRTHRRTP